ncbi:MAG: hypothetical protein NZ703_09730 [Gemmataceae bacterium]|nr:hypothetical protein [Gemmataceae bacterium]
MLYCEDTDQLPDPNVQYAQLHGTATVSPPPSPSLPTPPTGPAPTTLPSGTSTTCPPATTHRVPLTHLTDPPLTSTYRT